MDLIPVAASASRAKAHVPWTGTNALITPEPWMRDAACAEVDPDLWFPEKGGSTKAAKAVCAGCDVIGECLAYALRTGETEGIWGGQSASEIRKLRKAAAA